MVAIRAFFSGIVCFSTSNINTTNVNLNLFPDITFTPNTKKIGDQLIPVHISGISHK